jgi:hypothetical protein
MTKKVTQNMNYLNPQGARYLGAFVDVGSLWANLLLPLREQVSDGHTSGSLQGADSTVGGKMHFSRTLIDLQPKLLSGMSQVYSAVPDANWRSSASSARNPDYSKFPEPGG